MAEGVWAPPGEFEEYRLLRRLGRGAMGQVWLAHDTLLERYVAIKFLSNGVANAAERERFLLEARAVARLSHPNVVTIHRVATLDGMPYIVSEYLQGQGLDRLSRPVAPELLSRIAVDLARGLSVAHRSGVLHRDVKPANAFLCESGESKLLDFGLAKLTVALPTSGARDHLTVTAEPVAAGGERLEERATMPPPGVAASEQAPSSRDSKSSTPPSPAAALEKREDLSLAKQTMPASNSAEVLRGASLAASAASVEGGHGATSTLLAPAAVTAAHGVADTLRRELPLGALSALKAPQLTSVGAVMGTPLYLAPECFDGAPATRASDVYAWAALVYELAAGEAPARYLPAGPLAEVVRSTPARPLAQVAPQVPTALARLVDRCLERDVAARPTSAEEVLDALMQASAPSASAVPAGNPYRGLAAFELEHRALFFGRGHEVRSVIERLRSDPMVFITGTSGAGKSSLARAGILPVVQEGALGEGRAWRTESWIPGHKPLASLCARLAPWLGTSEATLSATLNDDPRSLVRLLTRQLGRDGGLVLFVDQFEELLTIAHPGEAQVVGEALSEFALRVPGLRLLATVRTDWLPALQSLPSLEEQVLRSLFLLGPLEPAALRQVVEAPAAAHGVEFESPEIIQEFVEFASAVGTLPIVQFALAELFDAREPSKKVMTRAALNRLGGVAGALARHADGVLDGLTPTVQAAARVVLLHLCTRENTRVSREAGELRELHPAAERALEALVRGRLVVARTLESGIAYELIHETLLTRWPRLMQWLREDDFARLTRQRLRSSAVEWQRQHEVRDALWSARQLAELASLDLSLLSPIERRFVAASKRALITRRVAIVGAVTVVSLAVAGSWWWARRVEHAQLTERVERTLQEASSAAAELALVVDAERHARNAAMTHFAANEWPVAEPLYGQALKAQLAADVLRSKYLALLESAFALDPARDDVQGRLADALFEAAQWARELRRIAQFSIEIERLRAFDHDGSRMRRLELPSLLAVHAPPGIEVYAARATPVGAWSPSSRGENELNRVRAASAADEPEHASHTLEQFAQATEGRTPEQLANVSDDRTPMQSASTTATQRANSAVALASGSHELAAGEWFLTLRSATSEARLPVRLEPGERLEVTPELPPGPVPEGMVWVPPGRFDFGATGDDELRRSFYETAPAHSRSTGGYFIGQHEITVGEYLEFLRALSPAERARHMPHVDSSVAGEAVGGVIELTLDRASVATYRFRVSTQWHEAREGQLLEYPGRTKRMRQNWLRFPLTGVSAEDFEVYVAWLAHTGRVPNARLCTELEWERAARGADSRAYPHGDSLEPDDANFDVTYQRQDGSFGFDEVGSHPRSDSPFGVSDLSGNAWELVHSSLDSGAYVIRGGCFFVGAATNRVYNRSVAPAGLRLLTIGSRVCADASR